MLAGQPPGLIGSGSLRLPGVCGVDFQAPWLNGELLQDVEGQLCQSNLNLVQRATDIFAWQQFIALNWPASSIRRGEQDHVRPLDAAGPRVWETWTEASDI